MTREDIIRMAREASNTPIDHHATPDLFGVIQLERFAALVASFEREACAKMCEQHGYDHYCGNVTDKLAETIRARGNT